MKHILGIDYRSLTLFRQVIALLFIFFAFVVRVHYFPYFDIKSGPFSNETMAIVQNKPLLVKIIHSNFLYLVLISFSLFLGIFIFLGIFTSLSSFLAILLYIWIGRRHIAYYFGTDEVIAVMLFAICLIYLLNPKKNATDNYISVSTNPFILVLLSQIALIYWFNGVNKTSDYWWSGEAVHMALFNVLFNKPFALRFLDFKLLNQFLTYFTLFFELTFPIWLFIKYKSKFIRIALGITIVLFHWGINLFADVTLYKFVGIGFFILLMPDKFWAKFPKFSILLIDFNVRLSKPYKWLNKVAFKLAVLICFIFLIKAINASIYKQDEKYNFIQNIHLKNTLKSIRSKTYSPFRQYWFMFAPSPPSQTGYVAFEYIENEKIINNINIYKEDILKKDFSYYHPFHMAVINQSIQIRRTVFPDESQFVLVNLFEFEINRDMKINPQRVLENYQLVYYLQSYEAFKQKKNYDFERIVLASYE